jgi:hypothetical protein
MPRSQVEPSKSSTVPVEARSPLRGEFVEPIATLFERTPLGVRPVDSTSAGCGMKSRFVLQTFHPYGVGLVVAVSLYKRFTPTGVLLVLLQAQNSSEMSTDKQPSKHEEREVMITDLGFGQSDIAAPLEELEFLLERQALRRVLRGRRRGREDRRHRGAAIRKSNIFDK